MYTNNKNLTQNNIRIGEVCKVLLVDYEKEPNAFDLVQKIRIHHPVFPLLILLIEKKNQHQIPIFVEAGIDDFVIKPINQHEFLARMSLTTTRAQRTTSINPLTKLPGNELVNSIILERLNKPLAILYVDLDHFKAYNDYYGYLRGDNILLHTANLLTSTVARDGNSTDIVGNIGGDDFVIITSPVRANILAQTICKEFDEHIKLFYDETDLTTESITTFDRRHNPTTYPLMTLSIAIVHNELKKLVSLAQISELAAELKRYAKSKPDNVLGSNFVKDRRRGP